jgi:hypothetical protein
MTNEELLKSTETELTDYCLYLEKIDEDNWIEVEREEDGYFRNGSKYTLFYFQVEWERDGYLLSYQYNEHSEDWGEDEVELESVFLRKK